MINNVEIMGIASSIKACKYPFATDTESCNEQMTERVLRLGWSEKGSGHDQFLTGIRVNFDLTFSLKAWAEAERYHFFDFVSSQSTMHTIRRFDVEKQCNEWVLPEIIEMVKGLAKAYNDDPSEENFLRLIYNIPTGFRLTARMTTNYRQLKTMHSQRKNHRLPEWREFCKWVETLPYFKELCVGVEDE